MSANGKIKFMFLDQGNEGLATEMEVDVGKRIDDFLHDKLGDNVNFSGIKIRMNGEIVTRTTTIGAGARIVISPTNIKGA